MPILNVTSRKAPQNIAAFTKRLSTVFAEQIGKSEELCLVTFKKADELVFAGTHDDAYLIYVVSIGNIEEERNARLTKAIAAEMRKELGINSDRGYILFTDYPAANIGHKDTTFKTILGL
ncbi:Tautomerase/MIF superfamily [Chlamydoabsidia padenii]|nr:Tautomerase/MIF superfamily [Chlamydoabsidia padenii]